MTESSGGVDPPFCKRSVQLTIAAFALAASLWQLVTWSRLVRHDQDHGAANDEVRRWGELSGSGHPLIQIDLNRAEPRELCLLPGVGPVLARRIVENRQRVGPFQSLEALERVHGIGEKTIEQIQTLAYVEEAPSGSQHPVVAVGGSHHVEYHNVEHQASSIGVEAPLGCR